MASAKKGKKNKGKTLPLSDFLQETPGQVATVPIRKSTTNWADEVEDNHDVYDPRSAKTSVVLPTAPKASRDFDDIIDKVPQEPPFIAYLTNLPYDVDENEISYFFRNMKIAHMRIPKDDRAGEAPRLKGFGYVEFEDRESLLNALVIPDTTIKNRRIRIEVATDYENDKRRMGRMDMNRDRNRGDMSSFGDWRSGPRQESNADNERRGFSRDRDRERDADSSSTWRDGDRRPNREPDRGFSREPDRGFSREPDRGFSRTSDRFRDDRDRDQDFSRGPRDDKFSRRFEDRGSRNGGGGGGGGGGGFTRSAPPPRDEEPTRNEPRQRPKLLLTPRTKAVEGEPEKVASSTSIFGNAKPVDTAARERQIEERLARDNDLPPKRDLSRERRDVVEKEKENVVHKEKEKENVHKEKEKENVVHKEKEKENVVHKEKKEKVPEPEEKKKEEKEKVPVHNEKSDLNGVIEKSHPPKRDGDHEKKEVKVDGAEKQKPEVKKREEKKEKTEKEMPKLKKVEPPNFVASNKFAYLENEDSSDE